MWIRKQAIDRSTIGTVWSGQLLIALMSSPLCHKLQPSRQSTCSKGNQVRGGELMAFGYIRLGLTEHGYDV